MKKIATILTLLCIATFAQEKGTFTDPRDKKTYKTTKIKSAYGYDFTWMAENLSYNASGSKCYGEGTKVRVREYDEKKMDYVERTFTLPKAEIQANCEKYGKLYTWATAKTACPKFY